MTLATCDTCLELCQGGARRYVDGMGHNRVGCQDDHACATAWSRLSAYDKKHAGHDCKAVERTRGKTGAA